MGNLDELSLECWHPKDLRVLEEAFGGSPAKERVNRNLLDKLSELIMTSAERLGLVESCYTDETEHALHPEATDIRSLIPQQRTNQVKEIA